MSDFNTDTRTQGPLDPYTRVMYPMGMVLGPDEFEQEQLYLMERDQLHNRALHGYGTVHGLHVSTRGSGENLEVMVSPGLAVDPQGQTIRVSSAQCSKLHAWLKRNQNQLVQRFGTPPQNMTLYVVLCYRECKTTMIPLRVGPCHSQEDSVAPSRIADDFELSLRLDPPVQLEENVVRCFGELLGRIEITAEPGSFVTQEEMEEHVRHLAPGVTPVGSPPEIGSPPDAGSSLRLRPAEACDILRAAFLVWVTEVRPTLLTVERRQGASELGSLFCDSPPSEPLDAACVLLAQLDCSVDASWQVQEPVTIDDDDRPVLLHTRLLQEWLLCGRLSRAATSGTSRTFATLFVHDPTTIRAWIHHPELLDIPAGAITIEVDDAPIGSPPQPTAVSQPVSGINVFDLALGISLVHGSRVTVRFDTSSISEGTSPARTLLAALEDQDYAYLDQAGNTFLAYLPVNLPALDSLSDVDTQEAVNGHVLTRQDDQWISAQPAEHSHSQYLTATQGDSRYAQIDHSHALNDLSDVSATPAEEGYVLRRQGNQWVAKELPAGVSDHGTLAGLTDPEDHPQYLLINGTRPLTGDQSAGNNKITNLASATVIGDAVPYQQAVKYSDDATEDLRGKYSAPVVAGLQRRPVLDVNPRTGDVLTWDGKQWLPRPVLFLPLVTITFLERGEENEERFEVWFNVEAPDNRAEITTFPRESLQVFRETTTAPNFLTRINIMRMDHTTRNVFAVTLQRISERLRFRFIIDNINLAGGETVTEYAAKAGIRFIGQGVNQDNQNTVTAFVRVQRRG